MGVMFRGVNGESCEETVKRVCKEHLEHKVVEAKRLWHLARDNYPQFLIEKEAHKNYKVLTHDT